MASSSYISDIRLRIIMMRFVTIQESKMSCFVRDLDICGLICCVTTNRRKVEATAFSKLLRSVRVPLTFHIVGICSTGNIVCIGHNILRTMLLAISPNSTWLVTSRHDTTQQVRRVEPMKFACVDLVEQHNSTRSTTSSTGLTRNFVRCVICIKL